jgi:hypothetical protein
MKTIASVITFAAILTGSSVGIYAQSPTQMLQMPQARSGAPAPMCRLAPKSPSCPMIRRRARLQCSIEVPGQLRHSRPLHPTDENVVVVSGAVTFGILQVG